MHIKRWQVVQLIETAAANLKQNFVLGESRREWKCIFKLLEKLFILTNKSHVDI